MHFRIYSHTPKDLFTNYHQISNMSWIYGKAKPVGKTPEEVLKSRNRSPPEAFIRDPVNTWLPG